MGAGFVRGVAGIARSSVLLSSTTNHIVLLFSASFAAAVFETFQTASLPVEQGWRSQSVNGYERRTVMKVYNVGALDVLVSAFSSSSSRSIQY